MVKNFMESVKVHTQHYCIPSIAAPVAVMQIMLDKQRVLLNPHARRHSLRLAWPARNLLRESRENREGLTKKVLNPKEVFFNRHPLVFDSFLLHHG